MKSTFPGTFSHVPCSAASVNGCLTFGNYPIDSVSQSVCKVLGRRGGNVLILCIRVEPRLERPFDVLPHELVRHKPPSCFLRQGLSLTRLGWLVSEPRDPPVSAYPALGMVCVCVYVCLFVCISVLCACVCLCMSVSVYVCGCVVGTQTSLVHAISQS